MKHDPWMGIGWNMMSLVEQKHIALGWEFVILRLLNSYISRAIIITCMVIQSFFPQTKSESHFRKRLELHTRQQGRANHLCCPTRWGRSLIHSPPRRPSHTWPDPEQPFQK